MRRRLVRAVLAAALVAACAAEAAAENRQIRMASTTSTENSGLFADILPRFTAASGITVQVIAVGTGAALRLGARGDVDVVLVHARAAEDRFVAAGHGIGRRDVMYNDFVLVGPLADPAGLRGGRDVVEALRRIARRRAPFASRGDDSGTHKAEMRFWAQTGIDPQHGSGAWFFETGAGMGATLNIAVAKAAYALTDRATWLGHRNRRGLAVAVDGDPRLVNAYGAILVNPARHPHVRRALAMRFIDWLTSAGGRAAIAGFRIGGRQVFFPGVPPLRSAPPARVDPD